jgi:hypothetical protein
MFYLKQYVMKYNRPNSLILIYRAFGNTVFNLVLQQWIRLGNNGKY